MERGITSYEQAIETIRSLLRDWIDNGVKLFLYLRRFEQSQVWLPHHKDFETCLREAFPNALGIVQYRHVIEAIEQHGLEMVESVGVHACNALYSRRFDSEPEKKEVFHELIRNEIDKVGAPPDADWLRKQRAATLEEPPRTRALAALGRASSLQQELTELKAELREKASKLRKLEQENAKLRKRLEKLEKKASPRGNGAAKETTQQS